MEQRIAQKDPSGQVQIGLLKFLQGEAAKLQEQEQYDAANPARVTTEQYGKWDVRYKKGGREYFTRVDSERAAEGLGDEVINVRRNDMDDDTPVDTRSKPITAREDINWIGNHMAGIKKDAAYWSRQLFKAQRDFVLTNPELAGRPDVVKAIKQDSENMLVPDPVAGRVMSKVASGWLLGGNVASVMSNGMQMPVRGWAEMTRLTGKPIESFRRVLGAMQEVIEGTFDKSKWKGPDHAWLADKYAKERTTSSAYDVAGEQQNDIALKLTYALNHGRPDAATPMQKAGRLINKVHQLSMWMFRGMEDFNTMTAMIAAFDHYKQKKLDDGTYMTREEAYRKAEEYNRAVNDVGGKANRPILLFNKMPKSAAMLATSMQSYSIGTVGQIVKLFKQGWGSMGKTPAERYNAKIATMQLFGVQLGLAGVLGMPFAAAGLSLLNQAFPQLEVNKNLRSWVQQLFDEDESHDKPLSDLAMSGIPSMFGWDFQSRLSMGNTIPGVSEINGIQPSMMETFVPTNILAKFIKGGQRVSQGDLKGVGDMMPTAVKHIWSAVRDEGKVRDYQGRPIVGGDRTWGELTGQLMGFQPTRLSNTNAWNRIKVQSENEHKRLDSQFNQDLAQDVLDGNFGSLNQKLRDRAAQDDKYDVFAGARKEVDAAAEMNFPRDLRRELTKNDAMIAQMLPVNRGQVSEMERAAFKDDKLRRIGVPMKPRDRAKYAIMDRLQVENPEWPREQLQQEAERQLGKMRRQQELLPALEEA
jgi:hypothetical protein